MAAQYLASFGVDLDALMSKVQFGNEAEQDDDSIKNKLISRISGARLSGLDGQSLWDVSIRDGSVSSIEPHDPKRQGALQAHGNILAPSLCHAHVHLDKCFLLQDPKYSDLPIVKGDFSEAMELTGEAKKRFEHDDLICRGVRLIEESVEAGVTAIRAFVEVDEVVKMKCVAAATELKERFSNVCEIQICVFAQLALFTGDDGGARRRELMEEAMKRPGVEVLGSTPYVESSETKMKQNVEWVTRKAIEARIHLDLHLDYNLDDLHSGTPPMVWHVVEELQRQDWATKNHGRTICLGHCSRLTQFTTGEWMELKQKMGGLPISFIGLPTSDLFMMGRPESEKDVQGVRPRGTLQIPQMIQEHGFDGAISINNIGNAFTPQGSCDPLSLASFGVGIYHAGTQKETELLYVSHYLSLGTCVTDCKRNASRREPKRPLDWRVLVLRFKKAILLI